LWLIKVLILSYGYVAIVLLRLIMVDLVQLRLNTVDAAAIVVVET
jgi:hypothetical protein